MFTRRKVRILAFDPGTRLMGAAVLENGKLIYHCVETIQGVRRADQRLGVVRKIVLRMIRDFRPRLIAYEKTFIGKNCNAALLNLLTDEIRALALKRGLKAVGYAPATVKKVVAGTGSASKWQVARAIAKLFPTLRVFLTQDRRWKERYHSNMFDAVAVGLTADADR
jgi:crossover junction endodeoxyribonuclease RuvC